jgi:hypothetical protein
MSKSGLCQWLSSQPGPDSDRRGRNPIARMLLAGLVAAGLGGVAQAGGYPAATPMPTPGILRIQNVFVDIPAQTILILGQNFNNGTPLTVKLANVGDISADCTPDFTVTPQSITCDLSAGTPALPIPGDYLLTVSTEPTGTSYGKWFSPD